ncbi:DEAD-box ATP-dependent RNA helicase 52B [Dionaea muscipula]
MRSNSDPSSYSNRVPRSPYVIPQYRSNGGVRSADPPYSPDVNADSFSGGYGPGRGRRGIRGRGGERGFGRRGGDNGRRPFDLYERFDDLKVTEGREGYGGGRGGAVWRGARGGGRSGSHGGGSRSWEGDDGRNPFDVGEKFDDLQVIDESCEADATNNNNGGINFDAYEDIPIETTGNDIPPPVTSFADIDLGDSLKENIRRCKYVKPTPIQRHAIPIAVAGRDLMACAQTGSGKTAAFCFPVISGILKGRFQRTTEQRGGGGGSTAFPLALILSPTRELSCQIHDEAKKFAHQSGIRVVVAYGGAPMYQQLRNLERGVDILVATPGRLVDMVERDKVSLSMIAYLALDEADRMLDMGFEPQIRKIVQQMGMPLPGRRQTMLFSATFPSEIQRLASEFLSDYIFLSVGRVGSSTDLIVQRVDFVEDMDKRNHLKQLLVSQKANGSHGKPALTLVFVETKKGADALESWLFRNGFPATAIHGDKGQMERERALKSFKTGVTPILVATDVAARGLDIPSVSHVINFDLPRDIDDYVHRIGRTGRAGKSGLATAFFSDKNSPIAKALVELMEEAKQEVPAWLGEYAERSSFNSVGGYRQRYRGGGRFGGHDFRSSSISTNSSPYYTTTTTTHDEVPSSQPFVGDYSVASDDAPASDHSYISQSQGQDYSYGSIQATGWD